MLSDLAHQQRGNVFHHSCSLLPTRDCGTTLRGFSIRPSNWVDCNDRLNHDVPNRVRKRRDEDLIPDVWSAARSAQTARQLMSVAQTGNHRAYHSGDFRPFTRKPPVEFGGIRGPAPNDRSTAMLHKFLADLSLPFPTA